MVKIIKIASPVSKKILFHYRSSLFYYDVVRFPGSDSVTRVISEEIIPAWRRPKATLTVS